MKIGIIGLGNIAQKAYLPLLCSKEEIEPILVTRNERVLKFLSEKYRIKNTYTSVDELVSEKVEAAFVHSSTESHVEIIEKLLKNNINVYVDKPISYHLSETERIVNLAKERNKFLMVGFNRRFAPMYREVKEKSVPGLLLMQKNRVNIPGKVRKFILDDFIHVVDTVRFLIPGEISDFTVKPFFKDENLIGIAVNFIGDEFSASLIMYRDNGKNEEILEVMGSGVKYVVKNLSEMTYQRNDEQRIIKFDDWDYILYRRGFVDIINNFINAVKGYEKLAISADDALLSHKLCEDIINKIESSSSSK